MNARRLVARATAVVASTVVVASSLATTAWAGSAQVVSGGLATNAESKPLTLAVDSGYAPGTPTVSVTLRRHDAQSDIISATGTASVAPPGSQTVTATVDYRRANPGLYDVTVSQGPSSDSCTSCVKVDAFKPVVTSVTPSSLGQGTTDGGYQPFVINGQNFAKGPYTQCSTSSCGGPTVAVYRSGTTTPDTNVTLSVTRNADNTGDAPTATTATSITLRISVSGNDSSPYTDDVVVTNSDGKSAKCAGCLTILPAPVVDSVKLVSSDFPGNEFSHIGQNATGQTVIVRGDRFPSDAMVYWLRPDSAGNGETINIGSQSGPQPDGDGQKIVLSNVSTTQVATRGDASGTNSWRAIVSSASLRNSSAPVPFPVTAPPAPTDLTYTDSSTGSYGQGAQGVQIDATVTDGVAGSGATPHTLIKFTSATAQSWMTGTHSATTTHALATLNIPESATTGGYPFRVVNPDGGASAECDNSDLLTPNSCLLTVVTGPKVTSVAPSSAAPDSTPTITIKGTGFHTGANAVAVRVGPANDPVFSDATVTPTNATTISVTLDLTGEQAPQDLDVVVTNNDDQGTGTKTAGFHVVDFTIGAPNPSSSTNDDSSLSVHVPGNSLPNDVSVKLVMSGVPNINGALTAHDANGLDATFDLFDRAPGAYDVVVTSQSEGTATCSACFTIQALAPTIDTVSPTSAGRGASDVTITVTGNNIYDGATLVFSNAGIRTLGPANVTEPHTLVQHISVASDAATGAGTVKVTNTDSQSSATKPFTVNAGPTVTGISPERRAAGSTFTLTVTGTNFQPGATVELSEDDIDVSNVQRPDATHVTATLTVPKSVTAGGAPVAVRVTVVNPDGGEATSPTDLTIDPPPSIDALDPSRAANTWQPFTLTITGDHFAENATVTNPDGQLGISEVTVVSANMIHATIDVSDASAGAHGIKVNNGDGGTDIAVLTVFTKPTAPRNVAAKSRNHALLVSWTTPVSNGGDSVTSYTATLKRHSTGKAVGSYTTPSASVQSHRFTGLTNGVRYDVRIVATNRAGNSPAATASGRPKYPTKLTIARSASSVDSGDRVALSGRLMRTDGTALKGRNVVIFRTAFTVTKKLATVTTDARGKWSLTFKPSRTAKYSAKFAGDRVNAKAVSGSVRITVQG